MRFTTPLPPNPSLGAQLVKNPLSMQEIGFHPLEKGKATHSSILA